MEVSAILSRFTNVSPAVRHEIEMLLINNQNIREKIALRTSKLTNVTVNVCGMISGLMGVLLADTFAKNGKGVEGLSFSEQFIFRLIMSFGQVMAADVGEYLAKFIISTNAKFTGLNVNLYRNHEINKFKDHLQEENRLLRKYYEEIYELEATPRLILRFSPFFSWAGSYLPFSSVVNRNYFFSIMCPEVNIENTNSLINHANLAKQDLEEFITNPNGVYNNKNFNWARWRRS